MTTKQIEALVESVENRMNDELCEYLRNNDADFEYIQEGEVGGVPLLTITVEWGDWKHSHGRLDYLMKDKGYEVLGVNVTEEDGSDCYSAEHIYYHKKYHEQVEAYKEIFKSK